MPSVLGTGDARTEKVFYVCAGCLPKLNPFFVVNYDRLELANARPQNINVNVTWSKRYRR